MLLGWAPKDNRERFTLDEFVEAFDPNGFQRSNPVFNEDKLKWFSGEYLRETNDSKLVKLIYDFYDGKYPEEEISEIVPLVKERIHTLREFETLGGFFFEERDVDESLLEKDNEDHLKDAYLALDGVDDWDKENIDKTLLNMIDKKGYKTGKFFMNLRIAITGNKATPPINESLVILGKEETLKRLSRFNK